MAQPVQPVFGGRHAPQWVVISLILALLAFACNFPGLGASAQATPQMILTYAAQTVQVQFTLAAIQLATQTTPRPIASFTPTAGTPQPSTVTVTPAICDRAGFIADVTYPDNTKISPNTEFVKTWRLKNTGTCTWNTGYSIVFDHGEAMAAPPSVPLADIVTPGQEIEVSVTLKTPDTPGVYQGYWQLRNAAGQVFGLGVEADKFFWVKIQVTVP